jgi:hypothetical protein
MNIAPNLKQRYFDANGNPLAGGKLYTYQAGTTTPQATYTDSGGGTANANPVILDANGEATVWLDPTLSYKFILADSSDTVQWTVDDVIGLITADAVGTASIRDDAITTDKILDDAVTADKLKDSASVDADRAVTTNHIRDGAITSAKLATRNYAISSAAPVASTTSTTMVDVTNLSVSITTTGRPVIVALVGSGSTTSEFSGGLTVNFKRGSTTVGVFYSSGTVECQGVLNLDTPAAGTYTYKVQYASNSGSSVSITGPRLLVLEL